MENYTDPIEVEIESPTIFERLWDGFIELMTLLGLIATIAFVAGYIVAIQPSSVIQCQPTKVVLAKGIFK
jgi:hypothetical protein